MECSKFKKHILSFILDLFGLIPVAVAAYILDKKPPFERGYFNNDESISYPYYSNTVPSHYVYSIGLPITFFIMIVFEIAYSYRKHNLKEKLDHGPCLFAAVKIYRIIFAFLLGYVLTFLLTVIGKIVVGRLRPHFFDLCQPVAVTTTKYSYVMNFTCSRAQSPDPSYPLPHLIDDMRKSFPSGHSSISIYNAIVLAWYISARLPSKRVWAGIGFLLQSIALGLAVFVCVSRIMDNKHHWSDVLAGGILGFTVACFVPKFITWRYNKLMYKEVLDCEAPHTFIDCSKSSRPDTVKSIPNQPPEQKKPKMVNLPSSTPMTPNHALPKS